MFGLKKKKSEDPPLPEDLPAMDEAPAMPDVPLPEPAAAPNVPVAEAPPAEMSSMPLDEIPQEPTVPSTHDQIPNDISLGEPTDFSPDSLPELPPEDAPVPEMPDVPDLPEEPMVEQKELPELKQPKDAPMPNLDDDVPAPPAIFSDESFYDTPKEIKHLVEEKTSQQEMKTEEPAEDYSSKYDLDHAETYEDQPLNLDKPVEPHPDGPIFVNIDSFRTMTGELDDIKTRIQSTSEIMQSLNDIKNSKDKELEKWRSSLEDLQKKLTYVDSTLFKEA